MRLILRSRASVDCQQRVSEKSCEPMPWYGVIVWWRDGHGVFATSLKKNGEKLEGNIAEEWHE